MDNTKIFDLIMADNWDGAWELAKAPGLVRKDWEAALRRRLYNEATEKYMQQRKMHTTS